MPLLRFIGQNWPFLLAGMLLWLTSSYGQTYFISVFAGEIRAEFDLSHSAWGGIYMAGTLTSAAVMLWAGTLTDRFRIRAVAMAVMCGLALACLAMAAVPGPVLLIAVIFALRLTGQGMMSQLAIVSMARWFVATRGRALSIAALGLAAGQAFLPMLFAAGLEVVHWRTLWVIAAGLVVLTMPAILLLLRAERSPAAFAESSESLGMGARHWTRAQVLRHPLFWCMVPTLLGPPTWGTTLFFQQVHLTEVKGWNLVDYVALLPVFTGAAVMANLVSGWLIDRIGSGPLLKVYLLPWAVGFALMASAESLGGAALALLLVGIGSGLQATIPGAFWAEYFGTRHLGAIKATAASVMVLGSALGPGISGVLIDTGVELPLQFALYAAYFLASAICAVVGLRLVRGTLAPA